MTSGIVHLGLGAFARAHLGEYTEDAGGWSICGVAPHSRTIVDALRASGGRYTLITRAERDTLREIGAFGAALHAPSERERRAGRDRGGGDRHADRHREGLPRGRGRDRAAARRARAPRCAGDGALARQPAAQRRGARARGRRRPAPLPVLDGRPRRPRGDGRRPRRRGRPRRRRGRAVPAVGDRGLRRPAAGLGRAVRLLQRAARGPQAAAAQRHALAAGLSRPAARRAHGRRRLGAAGARRRRGPARGRGPRPDTAGDPRYRRRLYRAQLSERWSNPRIDHHLAQIALDGDQKLPARFAEPARQRVAAGHPPRWIALALAAYDGAEGILDQFPDELRPLVDEWRERFARDGVARALRA